MPLLFERPLARRHDIAIAFLAVLMVFVLWGQAFGLSRASIFTLVGLQLAAVTIDALIHRGGGATVKSLSWLGVASAYSFTTGAVIFIMRVTLL